MLDVTKHASSKYDGNQDVDDYVQSTECWEPDSWLNNLIVVNNNCLLIHN